MDLRSLIIAAAGLASLLSVHLWLASSAPTELQIAQQMQGASWYRLSMGATHVGYMHTSADVDHEGNRHFHSTTHFLLPNGTPSTITKHLTFAARADSLLNKARFRSRDMEVHLSRDIGGYIAQVTSTRQTRQVSLEVQYSLADFLGFEAWLRNTQPQAGATKTVRSLDFERLGVVQRTYHVVEGNHEGYLVKTNAPLAATSTQLDENFLPLNMNMAGLFNVQRTSQIDAVPAQGIEQKPILQFHLDERISNHTELRSLTLVIDPPVPGVLDDVITLRHGTIQGHPNPQEFLQEESRLPITHAEIRTLAIQAGGIYSAEYLTNLVATIHQQLSYSEGRPAPDLLTAIQRGYGECTDFADLLTAVARSAGVPARTIFGLAYRDAAEPKLMFHAWNEVYLKNRWRAVDPTWNQVDIGASHLPLDPAQAASLMHAHNVEPRSFAVLGYRFKN